MPLPWYQILPFFVYSTKVLHQFQIELLNVCSTKLSTKYFGFSTKLFEDPNPTASPIASRMRQGNPAARQ